MGLPLLSAIQELRIAELKAELESRDLDFSGAKAVLVHRLHTAMEEEGVKPEEIKRMKKEQKKLEKKKKDELTVAEDVQPEDSVSQLGSKLSHHSSRQSLAGSVQSAAKEELMRSAARKAGILAKMEALRSQAADEAKLQSLIKELELKKQQGALLVQLAEEDAQQRVYAQCGGSRAGSVRSGQVASNQQHP